MKIEKIDIKTENKAHFTDIALLVGSMEFLHEANALRERLNLTILSRIEGILPNSVHILDCFEEINYGVQGEANKTRRFAKFNEGILAILKKFKRDVHFKKVTEYAVLAGCVPAHVYSSCFFDIVKIHESDMGVENEEYEFVIRLSSRTNSDDLDKAFEIYKNYVETKVNFLQYRRPESNEEILEAEKMIQIESEKVKSEIAIDPSYENSTKAIDRYLRRTRHAHELLLSSGELSIDLPEHYDLISDYHKGQVNKFSDTKNRLKQRIKTYVEWYWIANRNIIRGVSKKRTPSSEILKEWEKDKESCPVKAIHQSKKEKKTANIVLHILLPTLIRH